MMYQPLVDPEDFDVLEAKPIIIIHAPGADYDPTEGRCQRGIDMSSDDLLAASEREVAALKALADPLAPQG